VVLDALQQELATSQQPAVPQPDRVSLVPGRPLALRCVEERVRTPAFSVTVAEMLRYAELDRSGALGGRVVYARDFGPDNARLRQAFGDRAWYVAQASLVDGKPVVTIQPAPYR
jgi:hypothetical protein